METKLLELTTVAEGLHKRIIAAKGPYYTDRLSDLTKRVENALPGITGDASKWRKLVKDTRNDFAHRNAGSILDEATTEASVALLVSLQWVLIGVLLLQTGVPAATLADRASSHQPYRLFLAQAKTWLPEVYNSNEQSEESAPGELGQG